MAAQIHKRCKIGFANAAIIFLLFSIALAEEEPIQINPSGDWSWSIPFGRNYNYADIKVTKAIDGDTLMLESGERVRLIGIDTPEVHESQKMQRDSKRTKQDTSTIRQLGMQSWDFTKSLVEGKRVSLEFDAEKYDKYSRLLAYVFLKDGTFVNAEIVKQGYANLMTIPPNVKYAGLLEKMYREARENQRGLWK